MAESARARRIAAEWDLVCALTRANPEILEITGWKHEIASDVFGGRLLGASGLRQIDGHLRAITAHCVRLRFPRFYPAAPIEAYLETPLFHPNIDPQTGFVCLWTQHSVAHTAVEALRRLQKIVAFEMMNAEAVHLMQPAALEWVRQQKERALPLPFEALKISAQWKMAREEGARPAGSRNRLSTWTAA